MALVLATVALSAFLAPVTLRGRGAACAFSNFEKTRSHAHARLPPVQLLAKSKKPARKAKQKAKPAPMVQTGSVPPNEQATPISRAPPEAAGALASPATREQRIEQVFRDAGMAPKEASAPTQPPTPTDPLSAIPVKGQELLERVFAGGALLFGGIFISSGIAVAVEAVCKVLGKPLPVAVDEVLVQYVEPALTPSILILFFFSISLGVLKQLQLGSDTAGVLYREDDD